MFSYRACVTLILVTCLIYKVHTLYRGNCECGLSNTNRIVGGWTAMSHEFPWLVPIYNRNKLYCGGAIINNRYILTAGHCVRWIHTEDISIQVGAHDRTKRKKRNMYAAEEVFLHPNFYSYKLYDENDIALIKVNRPISFSNIVRPVCLPEKGSNYDNQYGTVAGWGKLGEDESLPAILQETIVKVLTDHDCKQTNMKQYLGPTVMCAFFKKADSCQGDSGGPLVYEFEPGKMEQIGIVSWGIGCGSENPGIYTRVTKYLDWIYNISSDGIFCQK